LIVDCNNEKRIGGEMSEKINKALYLIMLFIVSALVRNGIDNYFREKEKAERKGEVKKLEQVEVKSKDIMEYERL